MCMGISVSSVGDERREVQGLPCLSRSMDLHVSLVNELAKRRDHYLGEHLRAPMGCLEIELLV